MAASLTVCAAALPPTGPRAVVEAHNLAATVLTLEGGIAGTQTGVHLTPFQLQGYFCRLPNTCVPVDYPAYPGDEYIQTGADRVLQAMNALPESTQVILMGHSEGGQVIYTVLRRWADNPTSAPNPTRVSWVSIGNPNNRYGGQQAKLGLPPIIPADTPYKGLEVIRQYDGWADWPDNPFNVLAVANAIVGMATIHPDYFNVDINSPQNVRYTPTLANGAPGNITYVWVPTPVLPLVAGYGSQAPMLDRMLRPIVESAYNRPVQLPMPGAAVRPAATQTAVQATESVKEPEVQSLPLETETSRAAADSVAPEPGGSTNADASAPGDVPTRSSLSVASVTDSASTELPTSDDSEPTPVRHRPGRNAESHRSSHVPSWARTVSERTAGSVDKAAADHGDTE